MKDLNHIQYRMLSFLHNSFNSFDFIHSYHSNDYHHGNNIHYSFYYSFYCCYGIKSSDKIERIGIAVLKIYLLMQILNSLMAHWGAQQVQNPLSVSKYINRLCSYRMFIKGFESLKYTCYFYCLFGLLESCVNEVIQSI